MSQKYYLNIFVCCIHESVKTLILFIQLHPDTLIVDSSWTKSSVFRKGLFFYMLEFLKEEKAAVGCCKRE